MNPITLELTPEQFAALGSHTPGPRQALSPLPPAGDPPLPELDAQLVQAGLLDANRQVKEPFGRLFSTLGNTEAMLDLSWTDSAGEPAGFSLVSPKTVDASNPYAPTRVHETGSGGVVLRSPFTRSELQMELQSILGPGDPAAPKLEVGLTAPQAVVLAALMDCQAPPAGVNDSMLLESLQGAKAPDGGNIPSGTKRYFSVPLQVWIPPMDWNLESVGHVLKMLVRLGVCTQSGGTAYSLSEPLRKLREGCAVQGKVFWLTLCRSEMESDGLPETEAEHLGFCSSGTNLVFSWMNGTLRLKTFFAADLADMIAKEVFPVTLPPLQTVQPVAPAVRIAAAPLTKKKVPKGLIAGLVGVLLLACVLLVVGVVFLLI